MRKRPGLAISISIVVVAFLVLLGAHYKTSLAQADSLRHDSLLLVGPFQATGHITFLRVHDLGTGYGPGHDFIDGEVVIHLDSEGGRGFGFQLRNDDFRPAREGMFNLLRDAFNHNWIVTIDYLIESGKSNGHIVRVWLTKPAEE